MRLDVGDYRKDFTQFFDLCTLLYGYIKGLIGVAGQWDISCSTIGVLSRAFRSLDASFAALDSALAITSSMEGRAVFFCLIVSDV